MAFNDIIELFAVKATQIYIGNTHCIVVTLGRKHIIDAIGFRKQTDNVLTTVRKQSGQFDYSKSDDPKQIACLALMYDLSACLEMTMGHNAGKFVQVEPAQSLTNGMVMGPGNLHIANPALQLVQQVSLHASPLSIRHGA